MDIAVGQASGGPLAQGAEECRCPPGGSQYLAWADWPLILEMMNITLTAAQYSNYDLNQKPSCLQVTAASLASSVPPGITGIYGIGGEFQDVFFSNQNWHFSPCQFWKEDAFLILAFLSNQDTRIYKMIQYHCYRMSQLKSVFGYQWLFLYFWKYKYEKPPSRSMGPLGRCLPCPCNGNEESCRQVSKFFNTCFFSARFEPF